MELSVVVPTYNETLNIRPLCERLFASMKKEAPGKQFQLELLFVDDESEGTMKTLEIVATLKKEGYNVGIISRKRSEGRGLSSAVLLGFQKAKYSYILCMDADLQHEPEAVYSVAKPVLEKKAEFSIGSRYCGGGGFGFDWAIHRRLISSIATLLAFGVSKSSDPMSGFFCTRKDVLARRWDKINPIGFKIGLEIMARSNADPVVDVPITFQSRIAGESKLTMKQNVQYIQQLVSLYWDVRPMLVLCALVTVVMILWTLFNL
jgi:dolichol-phosphate mannosyltransferase